MQVVAGGIPTRVIERGQGSLPILFLHGNPDNATEWNLVIDCLGPAYRCIAFDLPGFGESPSLPESYDYSVEAQVDFLNALLRELKLDHEKIMIVAHDIGAVMGLAWAVVHPERVEGIVVSNAVHSSGYHWHFMAQVWSMPLIGSLSMTLMNKWMFKLGMRKDSPTVHQREVERMYAGLNTVPRKTIVELYKRMTRKDYFAKWERGFEEIGRKVPTVVIWGEDDPFIPKRFADRVSGRVRFLRGVGHWPPLEAPEIVAQEIRDMASRGSS